MTTSSTGSAEWKKDYVDLQYEFLPDDEAERLYRAYPELARSPEQGCPTCGGTKRVLWDGVESDCDCQLQLQLHKHYLSANIGLLYQRLNWSDYQGDVKAQQLAYTYLNNHEKMIRAGMGLIYLGEFGVGKTMLVSLVAKELVKLGYRVFFSTFTEMIDLFTKTWGDSSAKVVFEQKVVESEVFILDDVGKEFRSKNNLAESTFDHVLRQRAVGSRPTLLTTNMSEADLDEGYGGAIFSLLKERSVLHESTGSDWRGSARDRTLQEVLSGNVRKIY